MSYLEKMRWTIEDTRKLINLYRENPILWNPLHAEYKDRYKRQDAAKGIATRMNVPSEEIERKLKNLISQYRRELRNSKVHSKKNKDSGKLYYSRWFAFKLMAFLRPVFKIKRAQERGEDPESFLNQDFMESSSEEDTTEDVLAMDQSQQPTDFFDTDPKMDDDNPATDSYRENMQASPKLSEENAENSTNSTENFFNGSYNKKFRNSLKNFGRRHLKKSARRSSTKDPTTSMSNLSVQLQDKELGNIFDSTVSFGENTSKTHESELYGMLEILQKFKQDRHKQPPKDDFEIFGDLVARKLRKLNTKHAQITVQHLINNVLYEAELGKYDEPSSEKV